MHTVFKMMVLKSLDEILTNAKQLQVALDKSPLVASVLAYTDERNIKITMKGTLDTLVTLVVTPTVQQHIDELLLMLAGTPKLVGAPNEFLIELDIGTITTPCEFTILVVS